MAVLFVNPKAELKIVKEEWLSRINKIEESGLFVGGKPVADFEAKFAAFVGVKHAIGVGNGTDALFLALKALGIGPGDEVITAANTFVATIEAIYHTGAKPVLVDCMPDTFLMDVYQVKSRITEKTRAVIPVHLYGQLVNLDALKALLDDKHIPVVEDCAQAVRAEHNNRKSGSMGTLGCFSFYPDKNLGACGDGGAIVTDSDDLALKLKWLRNHGRDGKSQHLVPGFNSRLDPIQAALLEIKLNYLEDWTRQRQAGADLYTACLKDLDHITLPLYKKDLRHVFHLFVIRVKQGLRTELSKHLLKKGILTAVHYPEPVHLTGAFASLGYKAGDFPVAEAAAKEILSLPMHIALTEQDITLVAGTIRDFYAKKSEK